MTAGAQPLPTIAGPLLPIGPELERELALVFEQGGTPAELAGEVLSWAFDRALVVRSSLDATLCHVIVARDGRSRAARVVDAPAPSPATPPRPRSAEWSSMMPARRRR
jgi:hypothetical protein